MLRRTAGTARACAIVAGAAALVLEKYPRYTPAEVKQYLIDEATNDVINMNALRFLRGDKGTNKLLYVGKGTVSSYIATWLPNEVLHCNISITIYTAS